MRLKPVWTDSLALDIWYGWLIAAALALAFFALLECSPKEAHADSGIFFDMSLGLSRFVQTTPDGDYFQKDLPHTLDLSSTAYRFLLGYRINERWSVQGGRVHLGHIKQSAVFVPDENYDAKAGKCINGCTGQANYKITDAVHGFEASVTRTFRWDEWGLDLKGGAAYLAHRFTINRLDGNLTVGEHYGQFPATVAGIGASYKLTSHLEAYSEVDYYHGLGGSNGFLGSDQGWPLSKEIAVAWFGVKVGL